MSYAEDEGIDSYPCENEELCLRATQIARNNKQTVGEKNNYYITLAQLENLLMNY